MEEKDQQLCLANEWPELRVVMMGRSGVGKTFSGNTILNQDRDNKTTSSNYKHFLSDTEAPRCQKASEKINHQTVTIVETPGMFDPDVEQGEEEEQEEEVLKEIRKAVKLADPGPHVFLILLRIGDKLTEEVKEMLEIIQKTFGRNTLAYSMVLFTHGDKLRGQNVEEYIQTDPDLQDLIVQCHWKYHVIDNKKPLTQNQSHELIAKINDMLDRSKGSFYTVEMFKRAQADAKKNKEEEEEKEKEKIAQLGANKSNPEVAKAKLAVVKTTIVCGTAVGSGAGYLAGGGQVTGSIGAALGGVLGAVVGVCAVYLVYLVRKYMKKRSVI